MNQERHDMNRILWDKDARDRLRKRYQRALAIEAILLVVFSLMLIADVCSQRSCDAHGGGSFALRFIAAICGTALAPIVPLLFFWIIALLTSMVYQAVQLRRIKAIGRGANNSEGRGK